MSFSILLLQTTAHLHFLRALLASSAILTLFLLSVPDIATADVAEKSWQPDSATWNWGRELRVDMVHTHVDVSLDPAVVRVAGTATLTIVPLVTNLDRWTIDAERLTVESVKSERGASLPFTIEDHSLTITFAPPLAAGDTNSITIEYHGVPKNGLYFIPSIKADPDKVPMIWSQGQAEENRYWFPSWDYPNDRATSSVSVRTPRPNVVVSNGKMVRLDENSDGTRTFHWINDVPIPNYLIAVAVGQFDSLVQTTSRGLRCAYYCRKGEGHKLAPSMSDTPRMIEAFERRIGVPFPYAQYAQVMVTDFIHGGMENAGMTINTETTLHSAAAHPFYGDRTNNLVAHELGHQWFGDLVGYADWSHAWLSEGFATYLDDIWIEEKYGHDRFLLSMIGTHEGGIGAARTRRSTVHHLYVHPDDLYGSYAYSRAASVLHMIRGMLGDSLWWASINHYVTKHYAEQVETVDLKNAIEETSGRELDWFFDQWIFHGGHPKLDVSSDYDGGSGLLTVEVEQTQKIDEITPVFHFPLEVEWVTKSGRAKQKFEVTGTSSKFYLPIAEKPEYVLFDPEGWLLAEFTHKPSTSALLAQLDDSTRVLARRGAVDGLGEKDPSDDILAALTRTMRHDPQPSIRQAAADALGKLGTEAARDSLFTGLLDPAPSTRNRVIYALAGFENDDLAFDRLQQIANSNEMDALRGSAIDAAASVNADRAVALARANLSRRTEKYTVESDAFSALRRSKDQSLIPLALRYAQPGNPTAVRVGAVGLVGSLAKYEEDEKTRDRYSLELEQYLDDRNMNMRRPVMRAVGALGRRGAIPKLERIIQQSAQNSEWEVASASITQIRERKPEDTPNAVARQLDEEKEAREKLEKKVEDLEKRLEAVLEGKGNQTADASPK